jgi:hypothetical protein
MALVYPVAVANRHLQNGSTQSTAKANAGRKQRRANSHINVVSDLHERVAWIQSPENQMHRGRATAIAQEPGAQSNELYLAPGSEHWQRMFQAVQKRLADLNDRVADVELGVQRGPESEAAYQDAPIGVNGSRTGTLYSHVVELSNDLANEKRRWRRAMKDRNAQASIVRDEMLAIADGLKSEQQTEHGSHEARSTFGPEDFREMKMLFKASSSEFDALKDGINSLRDVQLHLRQNEQQLEHYEGRLDTFQRDLGDELKHLREQVFKTDAQAAAMRLTRVEARPDSPEVMHAIPSSYVCLWCSDYMRRQAPLAGTGEPDAKRLDTTRIESTVVRLEERVNQLEQDGDDSHWVEHSSPTGLSYFYNPQVRLETLRQLYSRID